MSPENAEQENVMMGSHGAGTLKTLAFCICLWAALAAGCGKKGAPLPDVKEDVFSFSACSAMLSVGGLHVECRLAGAVRNLEYAVLELEPVDGELCSGCPFTAVEQKRFEAGELRDESAADRISLSYRPARMAESYRWRLVGHNTISGLPDVDSDVATVENGAGSRTGIPAHDFGE